MNFYINNKSGRIEYISIHIHSSRIIIDDVNKKRRMFNHSEYIEAIELLEDTFDENELRTIEDFLSINLERFGVYTDFNSRRARKNKSNGQLKLF